MLLKHPVPGTAEAQICQAQRMEIVGQLTGGIVHDFNNILTVIIGTIEILAEAVADREDLASIANLIAEASARGADLTAHLLAFARGQPSEPRTVDINALLVDAARLLRPTLGEQIEIHALPAAVAASALVDRSRFMTVILNLAIMVRDAMPDGGKLVFATENATIEENDVRTGSDAVAGTYVMIAVSATGHHGLADWPERAFAGLGAILDFVRQSRGHIEVCSEASQEMAVKIYLPRQASQIRSAAPEQGEESIEGGSEAVLVVEDDAMVRRYVLAQIQSLGYRTLAAGDGREALAIVDSGEEIDLLFTDVVMPGAMNGRQLAIEALNRRPALRVLYTSGYSQNAMIIDGRLDTDVLLLAKPYRKIDLARMIRAAFAA
jgi:CheY-like chemotaxis protein